MARHRRPTRRPARLTLVLAAVTAAITIAAITVLLYTDPGCYQGNLGAWC